MPRATATALTVFLLACLVQALSVSGTGACNPDGNERSVQASRDGGEWECCSDDIVRGINFEVTVDPSSPDAMQWMVHEHGDSIGYTPTKCSITVVNNSSLACRGATCVSPSGGECAAAWRANRKQRLCLQGKCSYPSSTCHAAVRVAFTVDKKKAEFIELNQVETAAVSSAVVLVLFACFHGARVHRLRKQGHAVNFFSSASIRKRFDSPPQPQPHPPPGATAPSAGSYYPSV